MHSSFTVETVPSDARVTLLGNNESYRPGMALPAGDYRVEICAAGYQTVVKRVTHGNSPTRIRFSLTPDQETPRFFTVGSYADDVLRLQGTPIDIDRYPSLGFERWSFGYSSVNIDIRTRKVIEWDNNGNLKLQLRP